MHAVTRQLGNPLSNSVFSCHNTRFLSQQSSLPRLRQLSRRRLCLALIHLCLGQLSSKDLAFAQLELFHSITPLSNSSAFGSSLSRRGHRPTAASDSQTG